MSARSRMVGPSPFLRIPMSPVPPISVRTSKSGRERRCDAAVEAARCSCSERPGFWWRFL